MSEGVDSPENRNFEGTAHEKSKKAVTEMAEAAKGLEISGPYGEIQSLQVAFIEPNSVYVKRAVEQGQSGENLKLAVNLHLPFREQATLKEKVTERMIPMDLELDERGIDQLKQIVESYEQAKRGRK